MSSSQLTSVLNLQRVIEPVQHIDVANEEGQLHDLARREMLGNRCELLIGDAIGITTYEFCVAEGGAVRGRECLRVFEQGNRLITHAHRPSDIDVALRAELARVVDG